LEKDIKGKKSQSVGAEKKKKRTGVTKKEEKLGRTWTIYNNVQSEEMGFHIRSRTQYREKSMSFELRKKEGKGADFSSHLGNE